MIETIKINYKKLPIYVFADFLAGSLEAYIKLIDKQEQFIERGKEQFSTPNGYEEKLIQYRKQWIDVWDENPKGCRFDLVKVNFLSGRGLFHFQEDVWQSNALMYG
ncbi:MAG: hypothetical protein K0R07_2376 [Sedimentibacter sp.]|nr:hypothetical protein [Sedimentibacter sp.]